MNGRYMDGTMERKARDHGEKSTGSWREKYGAGSGSSDNFSSVASVVLFYHSRRNFFNKTKEGSESSHDALSNRLLNMLIHIRF